jgi:hypothetical protein
MKMYSLVLLLVVPEEHWCVLLGNKIAQIDSGHKATKEKGFGEVTRITPD